MRQAEYLDHEFDASGECDGSLTAGARKGAGSGTDLAGYDSRSWNEANGFELFFPALRW